jgi:hypothetical protein
MAIRQVTAYISRKTFLTEDNQTIRAGELVWLIQEGVRGPDLYQIRLGKEGWGEGRRFSLLRRDRNRCLGSPLSVGHA